MTYLGHRSGTGFTDPQNPRGANLWTVRFLPQELGTPDDFEVFHIAIRGPGGDFLVYIDTVFYSAADRGDINEYDPQWPMPVRRGQAIYFYWSRGDGEAPLVNLFLQTPRLGL